MVRTQSSLPTSEIRHVPALDGIRGIAVLAVLISHAGTLMGKTIYRSPLMISGWWGVDLFFVLSGYLITSILLRSKDSPNRLQSFYMRRILRIFPIYYLLIIATLIFWIFVPYGKPLSLRDRLPYFFFAQNMTTLWGGRYILGLGHLWSLAVEEQFYLVWPMLVWTLSRRALIRLSIGCCVLALIFRIGVVHHFGPRFWLFVLAPGRGDGLLTGAIIAILSVEGKRVSKALIAWMGMTGTAIIGFILAVDPREFAATDDGPYIYTIGVTGLALLFTALVGLSQYQIPIISPFLESRVLRTIGKYSYGMYVYHIPIFVLVYYLLDRKLPMPLWPALATIAAMCFMSFLVARFSYEVFESKFLRLKDKYVARRDAGKIGHGDQLEDLRIRSLT